MTGGGITRTHTINQAAATPSLTISDSNQSFSSGSGTHNFSVSGNVSWNASDNASWVNITSGTSGNGSGTVSYSVSANSSTSSRSATITVTGGGITRTHTINQAASSFIIGDSEQSFPSGGYRHDFSVSVETGAVWVANCSASWVSRFAHQSSWFPINVSWNTGSIEGDPGLIRYVISANASTLPRTASITVSEGGVTRTHTISQAGAANSLTINDSNQSFSSGGGTHSVSVSGNVPWNATDSASWVSITSGSSGSGSGTISYNILANTSTSSRSATITVMGGGITRTHTISQSGMPSLTIGDSSQSFSSGSGSHSFSVSGNVSWSASDNASWISISSGSSGSGNGTVAYSVPANSSTSSRSATITVTGGGITRTHTISQSGATLSLTLGDSSQSFSGGSGTHSFSVSGNVSWNASDSASWVNITSGSSGNGNGTIAYSVLANSSTSSRSATIAVTGGGITRTHTISQSGAESYMTINDSSQSFSSVGGSHSFDVSANVSWSTSENASWVTVSSGSSGNGNGTVSYNVSANSSTSARSVSILVSAPPIYMTHSISQSGAEPSLTISDNSQACSSDGETHSFSVSGNVSWSASSDQSWVSITTGETGSESGTVTYDVSANSSTSARSATIAVTGGGITRSCTITQSGFVATKIMTLSGDLSFGAVPVGEALASMRTSTISNTGNSVLTISEIRYPIGFSGDWSGEIAPGESQDVIVSFAPIDAVSYGPELVVISDMTSGMGQLSCSGTGRDIDSVVMDMMGDCAFGDVAVGETAIRTMTIWNYGNSTLTIMGLNCGSPFSADWSGEILAGNSQDITVTFSPTEEKSYSGGISANLDWSGIFRGTNFRDCSGNGVLAELSINDESQTISSSGGSRSFSVSGNVPWNATDSASWVSITSGSSGSGSGTISYNILANTSTSSRSATITVTGGGITRTHTISQSGAALSLTIGDSSQSFSSGSGTHSFSVSGNASWSASDSASWVNITSGSSGNGNGTIAYSVLANSSTSSRSATITVTGGGITRTHTISQSGAAASLSLGDISQSFSSGSGTHSFSVSGNVSWSATDNASWVSITSGSSGSGNGTVSYSVSANSSTSFRSATVTVAGGGIIRTHAINQLGKSRIMALSGNLSFGNVPIGEETIRTLTIFNTGNNVLNIENIVYPIGFNGNWDGGNISAGDSQDVLVSFTPSLVKSYIGILKVNSDEINEAIKIYSSGYGVATPPNTLVSWGGNSDGQLDIPVGMTNIIRVATGRRHALALHEDGIISAWGLNGSGQCDVPNDISSALAVAAGWEYSLALLSDGSIKSWGSIADVPEDVTNAISISAGGWHAVALQQDGTVAAWGDNLYGQCNIPDGTTNILAIAAGGYHSLALRSDGKVIAWGGQSDSPSTLSNVVAIEAGGYHSIALLADGSVIGWGENGAGTHQATFPDDLTNAVSIAAGWGHSLVLRSDGSVFACGDISSDQCAIPPWLEDCVSVAGGYDFSLALSDLSNNPVSNLWDAVDSPALSWTTGGDVEWSRQILITHDGDDAAQSGRVWLNGQSWMETSVVGPGTISFWWKVGSHSSDYLAFHIDSVEQHGRISGAVDWTHKTFDIEVGNHTLKWVYVTDAYARYQPDCGWVDEVAWMIDTYEVVFDLGRHCAWAGGGSLTQLVAYGETAALPEISMPDGVSLVGWDNSCESVTNDLLVTAQYMGVTNLHAAQRHGTKMIEISYDLFCDITNVVQISLSVKDNTSAIAATSLVGDVGASVATGIGRTMEWDMGSDWDGRAAELLYQVTAEQGRFVFVESGTTAGGAISVSNDFYIAKCEVTNEQMREVLQWAYDRGDLIVASPSTVRNAQGDEQELVDLDNSSCQIVFFNGTFIVNSGKESHPCVTVSWYGAAAFCNYQSEKDGRIPAYDLSSWELVDGDIDGDGHLDVDEDLNKEEMSFEDLDGDGTFDAKEDIDRDGCFDVVNEDFNGNGILDPGEDIDGDGYLDTGEDINHNGVLDFGEDVDGDGHLDLTEDLDGDGTCDMDEITGWGGILDPPEDFDGNGVLDLTEDRDGDGKLDWDEDIDGDGRLDTRNEDVDGDGHLDVNEDLNGNGLLDLGEDIDGDGHLDVNEDIDGDGRLDLGVEDSDGDGHLDVYEDVDNDWNCDHINEDINGNGILDPGEDIDGDRYLDTGEDINHNGVLDFGEDVDGDGHLDVAEYLIDGYRLPSDQEWEYVAHGGKVGNDTEYSGSDSIDDVAWYSSNSGGRAHVVATKIPNELGTYDMSGNVWEWCHDWHPVFNGVLRVLRGGAFNHDTTCRVSYRTHASPDTGGLNFGFRPVLPALPSTSGKVTSVGETAISDSRDYNLTVVSELGSSAPSIGTHSDYCWKSTVTCSVDFAVSENGMNYICTGWIGSGSIPPQGNTNTTEVIVLSNLNSFIVWSWKEFGFTDTDKDGLPDAWESAHGDNLDPAALCANGVNTVREAYIAGLDPTNATSRLILNPVLGNALHWSAISGRVYSIWWTTNLLENFQPLETDIPWPQGGYTNPRPSPTDYYKIKVKLE